MGVFRRVLSDGADIGLLVLVVLFMYGLFYAFGSVLSEVHTTYALGLLASPDPIVSLRGIFLESLSILSDPLVLLSMIIYGVLLLYLSLVVIGWISKRRISYPENPFKRALSVLVPSVILGIIVSAPVFLLFSPVILLSSNVMAVIVFLLVFFVVLLVYVPVVFPSVVSLVVDSDSVSGALRNGVLVGRRRWLRIVLYLLGVSLVSSVILYVFGILSLFFPWAQDFLFVLYQAISFVLPLAVFAEVYIADAHGE